MVYCKYKKHNDDSVIYAYGGDTNDITGEIKFAIDGTSFEIVKEPEKSTVYLRSIKRLCAKYKADFSKHEFKQKISYEC